MATYLDMDYSNETALGSVLVFAVLIATVNGWFKKGLDWSRKTLVGSKV